jgi:hypothetical protein
MKTATVKILIALICIIATAFTLSQYALLIQHLISIQYSWYFELFMVLGMLVFQYPFIHSYRWGIKLNYYYEMLMVSVLGSALLWPLLIMNQNTKIDDILNIGYFFAVVVVMFFVHKNIVKKLALPFYASYTYILYRFIILLFIL